MDGIKQMDKLCTHFFHEKFIMIKLFITILTDSKNHLRNKQASESDIKKKLLGKKNTTIFPQD